MSQVALALNERKKCGGQPPRAGPRHYRPKKSDAGRLELSTFCIQDLAEGEKWSFLDKMIKAPDDKVPARVDIDVSFIRSLLLDIDENWIPPRHVDIIGWGEQDNVQQSVRQRMSAQLIATLREE